MWYIGTGTASIMGALVAYGLLFYTEDRFHSWQLLFLISGLTTIAVGICVILFLPDNPMSSKLSHDEKVSAIERLRENKTGIENKHWKKEQFLEVFRDPQTYFISVVVIAMDVPNGAVSSFSALIIKSLGFTTKQTELLSIPSGVISVISILVGGFVASKTGERCICAVALLSVGLLGGCLLAFAPGSAARLAGNYLTNCIGAALPLMYSIAGANYAGHTKKVTMNAVLLMSFCLGNILGPLTFRTKDAPGYQPAKVAIVATVAVAMVAISCLRVYYTYENRRRDRKREGLLHQEDSEFADMTDRQNREFRVSICIFIYLPTLASTFL
jgi:sugar phosphate permease